MKNLKRNGIILLFITLLVIFLVLKDDFNAVVKLLASTNLLWIFVACCAEFLFIFLESLAFKQIIDSYKENYSLGNSFKLLVITKFFNGITPFASGGQPMQIYLMKKDGIRMTKSTNIIMQNFIVYQLALVTFGFIALLLNHFFVIFPSIPLLRRLVAIGFLINTFVTIMLFVISFSKNFNRIVIKISLGFLNKIGFMKDYKAAKERWQERCNDFHKGAEFILANKMLCFKCYIYNLLALACLYITPLFVLLALGNNSISIRDTLVASSYVMVIGSFVPIPGGSGGIEYGYTQFFGNFISGGLLSASLLVWRFITYYVPLIVGAVLFNLRNEDKK